MADTIEYMLQTESVIKQYRQSESVITAVNRANIKIENTNPAIFFIKRFYELFLGFTISVIALLGFKGATITSLVVPSSAVTIAFITALIVQLFKNRNHETNLCNTLSNLLQNANNQSL